MYCNGLRDARKAKPDLSSFYSESFSNLSFVKSMCFFEIILISGSTNEIRMRVDQAKLVYHRVKSVRYPWVCNSCSMHPFSNADWNSKQKHLHVMLNICYVMLCLCFIALKNNDNANNTWDFYGNSATIIAIIRNCFKKFRMTILTWKIEIAVRPAMMNTDFIKAILAENPRYSVQEIVD